ncbi:MAG: DUF1572 family protein [Pirellulales bacterium]
MPSDELKIGQAFLDDARAQLQLCRQRLLHCVDQLNDEQLWWRAGEQFNSIANLMLHLAGNVGQRIGSLIGGLPNHRNRDQEFAERGPIPKAELLQLLDDALESADAVLAQLAPQRLLETRTYPMLRGPVEGTFVTLILQTLVHLGGHTQEIVSLTRLQLRETYRFMQ